MEFTLFIVGDSKEQSLYAILGLVELSLRVPKALTLLHGPFEIEAVTHARGGRKTKRKKVLNQTMETSAYIFNLSKTELVPNDYCTCSQTVGDSKNGFIRLTRGIDIMDLIMTRRSTCRMSALANVRL